MDILISFVSVTFMLAGLGAMVGGQVYITLKARASGEGPVRRLFVRCLRDGGAEEYQKYQWAIVAVLGGFLLMAAGMTLASFLLRLDPGQLRLTHPEEHETLRRMLDWNPLGR